MKTLKEALISKDKRKWATIGNKFGITKKDLIGNIKDFPLSVVVRMMEEQERQDNTSDVTVFQKDRCADVNFGGFDWDNAEDDYAFWSSILTRYNFKEFYKKYPEYKKYDM